MSVLLGNKLQCLFRGLTGRRGLWHELSVADRKRDVMVFQDYTGWRLLLVLTVMAVHSCWIDIRSECHYNTLGEAVAIVNR